MDVTRGQIPMEVAKGQIPLNTQRETPISTKAADHVPPQIHQIQTQISALQHSFDEARLVVDQLICEVNDLEMENDLLRQQNCELERSRDDRVMKSDSSLTSPTQSFETEPSMASPECTPPPFMYGVDEIVDALCGIQHHVNVSPSSYSLTPMMPATPPHLMAASALPCSSDSSTLSPPTLNYPLSQSP